MLMMDINTLAEYLADNYEWEMELNEDSVTVYAEDVTVGEILELCSEVENINLFDIDYPETFKIGLSLTKV